jgi:quercetin dioxygenase-like cupin family protein
MKPTSITRALFVTLIVAGLSVTAWALHDQAASPSHVMAAPGDLKWADGPPSLPAGSKAAVLEGDPAKPGLFTLRLQVPANYRIPAHWHPADEHVTVISGTFYMGMGDKLDESKGKALASGSFAWMPPKTNHFAFTKTETVIQLHGMGPWGITYVNPADDPRKR